MSKVRADDYLARDGVGAPDFSGGINATGVITATSFSGSSTGLTGTPSITVQDVTAVSVSVSGTMTYEDVTSVDSVGVVTARSGVVVNTGGVLVVGGGVSITAGGLDVMAGVTTISGTLDVDGAIDADGSADVAGGLTADNINVTGITTTQSAGIDDLVVTRVTTTGSVIVGSAVTLTASGIDIDSGIVTATSFDGGGNVPAGQTGSVTLAASDTGRFVSASGGITVPASIFATGDVISIYNNTGGNITITCSAPSAVYLGTDGSTKTSLTLTTRCICTIICVDSSSSGTFVATGGGLA